MTLKVSNYDIHHVLIDNGSSMNILFYDSLVQINLILIQLKKLSSPLVGFAGNTVSAEGVISLPMIAGQTLR